MCSRLSESRSKFFIGFECWSLLLDESSTVHLTTLTNNLKCKGVTYWSIWIGHYTSVSPRISGYKILQLQVPKWSITVASIGGFFKSFPSLSHLYLRGGAPVAWHFSLMECDAGHALNDLFRKFGSVNTGAPAKVQPKIQIFLPILSEAQRSLSLWFILCTLDLFFFRNTVYPELM